MKSLFLLRHANAQHTHPGVGDFDRGLTGRGMRVAEQVGRHLGLENIFPDLVLSSPAVRARQTAEIVLAFANASSDVRYVPRIYEATARDLLDILSGIEENRKTILLVAHNPSLEELLRLLTKRAEGMRPGTLANIRVDVSAWSECNPSKCALEWLLNSEEGNGN